MGTDKLDKTDLQLLRVECYNISGNYDYLLKVHATDMRAYQSFVINTLGGIESLGSIESTFVMDEIKQSYGLYF